MNPCSSNPHCSRANRPSGRRDDIRVDILVSYWILEEKLSVFSTDHEAGWGLLINSLYHAEEIFFYAYFVELFLLTLTLIMSGCGTQPDAARAWTALRCSLSLWASLRTAPSGAVFFTLLHSGCQSPAESQTAVCSFSSCGVLDLVSRKCWFNKTVWKEAPYFYFLEVWEG